MRMGGVRWLNIALAAFLVVRFVPAASAASAGPTEVMDGIRVQGADDFRRQTRDALDNLGVQWHAFVTHYLTAVTLTDGGSGVDPRTGRFKVTRVTAFSPDRNESPGVALDWYACVLVHEAQHVYQGQHSGLHYGREAELDAMGVQLACLRDIGASPTQIDYLRGLMDCVEAGQCKYWEGERTW